MSLTPEQLKQRLMGIGSSEVPAILDIYPTTWKKRSTPESVFAEKIGEAPGFEGNARTKVGERLEPYIAQWWGEDHGRATVRNTATVAHPVHEWALATVDFFTADEAAEVLECKVVSPYLKTYWQAEPAPWAFMQVQWQLGVLGKTRGHIAAHIQGGDELVKSYAVEFDPVFFEDLVAVCSRFMTRVQQARAERGWSPTP